MNQHPALTTETGLPGVQSLLKAILQNSEGVGSACAQSEYEPPNVHSFSNGVRKPTANTQSISEPRSTVQLYGPGQPLPTISPTTPIGSMPSPRASSLVNNSQSMNFQFLAINDPRRKPNLERRMAFSIGPSHRYEALGNTRLQSMGSRPSIDATKGFFSPTSTTVISPQDVQGIQEPSGCPLDMQPYPGTPPSGKAAPLGRGGLFEASEKPSSMTLPGSGDPTSVPVDAQYLTKEKERRARNAVASEKYRKKKKKKENELFKKVEQLQMEVGELRERMKKMEEEQNSHRDLIRHARRLIHCPQALDLPSHTSKTTLGTDGLATEPQNYGGGTSPGERPLKHRRTSQVPGLPTPACGASVNLPTGGRGVESELWE